MLGGMKGLRRRLRVGRKAAYLLLSVLLLVPSGDRLTLNPTAPPTLMLPAFMWFPTARTISSTLLKDLLVCSCTDARLMASRSCQIVSINQYVKSHYLNTVTDCQFPDVMKTYWFYLVHFFTEVHTKNHCSQTFTIVGNGAHLEISRPLESITQSTNQSINQSTN